MFVSLKLVTVGIPVPMDGVIGIDDENSVLVFETSVFIRNPLLFVSANFLLRLSIGSRYSLFKKVFFSGLN